ncbi:UNVERIFIED_CONTAM: hypothetical protein HDU68_008884 [Siphonaria sp. JEL0065]|nr:hypothetical protein HDU68_008884 [Siphonaria sp. JEL0065]
MAAPILHHRTSQILQERPSRTSQTPPPPYEGDDAESSTSNDDDHQRNAQTPPSPTATISMVKARLAKKKSIQLLRRMSSVSQELTNDHQQPMDQLQAAMKQITDTQEKLAQMVQELREIAMNSKTHSNNSQQRPIDQQQRLQVVEEEVSRKPDLERAPSVRRKKAASNLALAHETSIPSKLSTVVAINASSPVPPSSSIAKTSVSTCSTPTSAVGGSIFHDPDDTKKTPPHVQRRISSYMLNTSPKQHQQTLRRHSSFVASPKYPTPDHLLVPEPHEDAESFDRVKNLIESLLSQASEALEAGVEKSVSYDRPETDVDLMQQQQQQQQREPHENLENKNNVIIESNGSSYMTWLESHGNDLEWSREVVISAVPLLCAAAEQELLKNGGDEEEFAENEASAIQLVQNVLGTLLSMLVQKDHVRVNTLPITYVVPAIVQDEWGGEEVESFVRKIPKTRLRRISFDAQGNEVEGEVLERSRMEMNHMQVKVSSLNSAGFLETLSTVMSLQFSLFSILAFSAWVAVVGRNGDFRRTDYRSAKPQRQRKDIRK